MTLGRAGPRSAPARPPMGADYGFAGLSDGMLGCMSTTVDRRRLPSRLCLLCAILALTSGFAFAPASIAAAAGGSGSAFSELTESSKTSSTASTPATTSTTSESSTTTSNSSSSTVLILALVAAAVLIGGIAFAILRDARRMAPVADGRVSGMGRPSRDPAVMMRKRRAKAKAARRQRKRNR